MPSSCRSFVYLSMSEMIFVTCSRSYGLCIEHHPFVAPDQPSYLPVTPERPPPDPVELQVLLPPEEPPLPENPEPDGKGEVPEEGDVEGRGGVDQDPFPLGPGDSPAGDDTEVDVREGLLLPPGDRAVEEDGDDLFLRDTGDGMIDDRLSILRNPSFPRAHEGMVGKGEGKRLWAWRDPRFTPFNPVDGSPSEP